MNLNTAAKQPKLEPEQLISQVDHHIERFHDYSDRKARLTDNQKLLLAYMLDGNSISVCTEVGLSLGRITGHEYFSGHFAKRSFYGLVIEGLLDQKEESIYGIEWTTFHITDEEIQSWQS